MSSNTKPPVEGVMLGIFLKYNFMSEPIVTIDDMDAASIAYELESTYHIMTRVGLHCAPRAHQTLGTYPEGTIRFSFGYANRHEDVEAALSALNTIVKSSK